MIGSRPDLAFALQDVSRYLSCYGEAHWEAVKRCIRYLKATRDFGLEFSGDSVVLKAFTDSDYAGCEEEFSGDSVVLKAFTDSDYAGCEDDRKSVSGYMIGNCVVT
ncbi:Gag-pol Polyprotein [Phytophthora megakarya]|uniref:Gag-pol Polyprotein n=1 Tax=Phytophthora megakarya TaxID=4795 RepID=A0A225UC05_9STRA|nr:Gag-pol Polyprotein [Phytophthora megakarya]